MKIKKFFLTISIFLIVPFILSSCLKSDLDQKPLDINSYYRFLNNPENGLVKRIENGELIYTSIYVPAEINAYVEMTREGFSTDSIFNKYRKRYLGVHTIHLIIQPRNDQVDMQQLILGHAATQSDVADIYELLNYELDRHIYLQIGKNNVWPKLYTLESSASSKRKMDFMFVFDKPQASYKSDYTTIVLPANIFQKDSIFFAFENNDINNLPALAL